MNRNFDSSVSQKKLLMHAQSGVPSSVPPLFRLFSFSAFVSVTSSEDPPETLLSQWSQQYSYHIEFPRATLFERFRGAGRNVNLSLPANKKVRCMKRLTVSPMFCVYLTGSLGVFTWKVQWKWRWRSGPVLLECNVKPKISAWSMVIIHMCIPNDFIYPSLRIAHAT